MAHFSFQGVMGTNDIHSHGLETGDLNPWLSPEATSWPRAAVGLQKLRLALIVFNQDSHHLRPRGDM